jgi:flagellar biosynthesis/type III secretory pathway M-ring protein FliF/YscJ|tara:strand:+ start:366 stop:491 length:126 start_codon:yes stop_codon:yes gene_type:complete
MDMIKQKWNQLNHWWGRLNKKGKLIVIVAVVVVLVIVGKYA